MTANELNLVRGITTNQNIFLLQNKSSTSQGQITNHELNSPIIDSESDSDEGWQITKPNMKRSRNRYHKLQDLVKRKHLEDPNQYAVLATLDGNEMQQDTPSESQHDSSRESQPVSNANNSSTNHNVQTRNEPRPPPVFIPGVANIGRLIQHLCANGIDTNNEVIYKTLRNNEIKLMVKTIDCYRKLINFLNKEKAEFHTKTAKTRSCLSHCIEKYTPFHPS